MPKPELAPVPQARQRWRALCVEAVPSAHWSDARFTGAAVLAAMPCGYGLGVVAAYLLTGGPDIGQMPLVTVPLALLVTGAFAVLPALAAEFRFMTASVGA